MRILCSHRSQSTFAFVKLNNSREVCLEGSSVCDKDVQGFETARQWLPAQKVSRRLKHFSDVALLCVCMCRSQRNCRIRHYQQADVGPYAERSCYSPVPFLSCSSDTMYNRKAAQRTQWTGCDCLQSCHLPCSGAGQRRRRPTCAFSRFSLLVAAMYLICVSSSPQRRRCDGRQ